jgi:hypothetical protein
MERMKVIIAAKECNVKIIKTAVPISFTSVRPGK